MYKTLFRVRLALEILRPLDLPKSQNNSKVPIKITENAILQKSIIFLIFLEEKHMSDHH